MDRLEQEDAEPGASDPGMRELLGIIVDEANTHATKVGEEYIASPDAAATHHSGTGNLQISPEKLYESGQPPGKELRLPDDIKKKVKRAIREATGKKTYVPESREGTTMLGVHLKNDLAEDFKLIATLQRTTAAKILKAFVEQYVEQHKSPQQVQEALRDHVEHLSGDRDTAIARALRALAKPKR